MSEIFKQARAGSKIDPQDLIQILYGNQQNYNAFVEFAEKLRANGLVDPPNITEYSRSDQMDYALRHTQMYREKMQVDFYQKSVPDVMFQDISIIAGGVG